MFFRCKFGLVHPNSFHRVKAGAENRLQNNQPYNSFTKTLSAVTAVFCWVCYQQFTPAKSKSYFKVPPVGTILLLVIYVSFVLGLEFYDNNIEGAQHYTAIAVRAAWLGVAQIPLLILLAGKNNLIGFITGLSYERLNVLHRWVARVLLLLITIHFASQNIGWDQYGLRQLEWSTDTCPPTGIAAYSILLWINLSTLVPFRNFSYEFFVLQHLITFFGFIIAVMMHLPTTALYSRTYIYIGIGLYLLDRILRTARYAYHNIRPGRATLTALDGGVTRICVETKQLKKWTPGSHVFVSIPRYGLGQAHPATIASIPSSHNNDLVFILKAHKGFTKRIMLSANPSMTSLTTDSKQEGAAAKESYIALIDGPYGGSHPDFAAFEAVVLISGSTGATFTLPILLDIAHRSSLQKLPVRLVEFIWCVKKTSWTSWISEDLHSAFHELQQAGIEIRIRIFVTCDESFAESASQLTERECQCREFQGQRYCICINDAGDTKSGDMKKSAGCLKEVGKTPNVSYVPPPSSLARPMTDRDHEKNHGLVSCATFKTGRPSIHLLLQNLAEERDGKMAVAVCGPVGLNSTVRMTVARICKERILFKGKGVQSITLHAECFDC
jgi:ferric-chelate reductase